ncbi:MAG: hypothetical protein K2Q24_06150 [Chitinophagaceae bacterium]|jgi:hypothetical protein|nr:hypothetical protein [Chitinophagaceae bacterium]
MEENKPIINQEEVQQPDNPQDAVHKQEANDERISPGETTADAEQPQTINYKPETEDMEVHHHTHHEHGKRNWKSYFWEFLMLFLAVFCGFLAEYQLEHKIERDRAKELAKSFYSELKKDSVTATIKIENRLRQESALKYLIHYFRDSSLTNVSKTFAINFEYGISFRTPTLFEPRTIMLEQLKNSGSLRYFKNETLQELIGDLTVAIKNVFDRQNLEQEQRLLYINPILINHYDYDFNAYMKKNGQTIFENIRQYETSNEVVPFKLNQVDKFDRQDIINRLNFYLGNVLSSTRQVHIQKYMEVNAVLLKELRKEYHLK